MIIIIKMSEAEMPSRCRDSKMGTPQFGIVSDLHDFRDKEHEEAKINEADTKDRNWPDVILQQSSNSSDNNLVCLRYEQHKNAIETEVELVYIKQQSEVERTKKVKTDKNKNEIKLVTSLTDKYAPIIQNEKENSRVTSSLGYPPNIEITRKKTVLNEKEAEEDCKIYKNGAWTRTKLMLTEDRLAFFQCSFDIKDLEKIKILPSINSSKTKSQNIIKMVADKQTNLFSLGMERKSYELPASYFIFAKLIEKKLFLSRLVSMPEWQKSEHAQKRATEDSYIYGNIFKKSQHLGNWETRFVVVRKNGIYSYKNSSQEENYSFCIASDSIKYIWTRFEKIDDFLVVKVKHGIFKTEFGIPLSEFSVRSSNNWLYALYRTLPVIAPDNISPAKLIAS